MVGERGSLRAPGPGMASSCPEANDSLYDAADHHLTEAGCRIIASPLSGSRPRSRAGSVGRTAPDRPGLSACRCVGEHAPSPRDDAARAGGRQACPTAAITDTQSVKTTEK